ncbi:MAG: bifunctional demethylmenaquinone methyltransferase/2-methoxy-6-polyprenyl-1,4-benzoquinol methylase UbiE [Gammaproteobacteria bacterium]|nr:bifunctional demethylmenaquinone methyltransferase/2-methoxy-6-polyprenyl-1,4-benzoquinol methylase UbiE [Gammaproteobacteria bacterium]
MTERDENRTHFGYEEVPVAEKRQRVGAVFTSVARRYDIMNDVMSMGIHRLWKTLTVHMTHVRSGQTCLDLAAGTGDIAAKLAKAVGSKGRVVACDINRAMLSTGRDRLLDRGLVGNIDYIQADAEALPFADNSFDCATMAFGLRNVTHKERALASLARVLKPGARLYVLEFSKPVSPLLSSIYDQYSFKLLPAMGKLIAGDADSYRYLAESIRMHPDQETLKKMMLNAGFDRCEYLNLSGGIVALHQACKF